LNFKYFTTLFLALCSTHEQHATVDAPADNICQQ